MGMSLAERMKALDKLSDNFNKKNNKVTTGRLGRNDELKEKISVKFIETPSLNVNYALGGGFPRGRISIVAGQPDSGKTFLLLETIAKRMKEDPDFMVGWLESEESINIQTLEDLGIDLNRFYFDSISRDGAAEEALNKVEAVVLSGAVDMFVINSLKCLVPSEELQKGMEQMQVGLQARMNAKMMRKLTTAVAEQNVAFVMVQHLTTQIGTMARDPLILSGGQAIKYGASIIMDLRKRSMGESDPFKKEEAIKVGVTIQKNHVVTDRFPYMKLDYYAVFGQGIDTYLEILNLALDAGILVKSGAFIKVPDENGNPLIVNGEKMQWQGNAKFKDYCKEHPSFFNGLKDKLNGKGNAQFLSEEESEEFQDMDKDLSEISDEDIEKELKAASKASKTK